MKQIFKVMCKTKLNQLEYPVCPVPVCRLYFFSINYKGWKSFLLKPIRLLSTILAGLLESIASRIVRLLSILSLSYFLLNSFCLTFLWIDSSIFSICLHDMNSPTLPSGGWTFFHRMNPFEPQIEQILDFLSVTK